MMAVAVGITESTLKKHFDKNGNYNWLSDDGLNMLQSIVEVAPNLFYNKIAPHCFKTEEIDKQIQLKKIFSLTKD